MMNTKEDISILNDDEDVGRDDCCSVMMIQCDSILAPVTNIIVISHQATPDCFEGSVPVSGEWHVLV